MALNPPQVVEQYFEAALQRWQAMRDAGIDSEGYDRLYPAIRDLYQKHQLLSPGEAEYLWDRTDPAGKFPNYNRHRGLHLKYGSMLPWPEELMDYVNWNIPHPFRQRLLKAGYKPPRPLGIQPLPVQLPQHLFTEE
jgi:hypothetical protein